jgi:hypothetical protein
MSQVSLETKKMNRGRMPRTTVKRLPPKFAEKMLQLEMDLDYHCNMNTL